MIERLTRDGFTVHVTDRRALDVWDAFRRGAAPREPLKEFARKASAGGVYAIPGPEGRLVMKHWRQLFRPQEAFFRMTRPNYLFRLIRAVDAAREAGDAFTADVHLAAERWRGPREGWECFCLMDFVEGPTLHDAPPSPAQIDAARALMEAAHRHGLATDAYSRNYIVSPAGLRLIDLNGRPRGWLRTGRDYAQFERAFGAPPPARGLNYRLARWLHRFREFRRGDAARGH